LEELFESRREKLRQLREMGIRPYEYSYEVTHSVARVKELFGELSETSEEVSVAGRLMAKRGHGKAGFGNLQDRTGRIQIYFRQDRLGEDRYRLYRLLDIGDWIGVRGTVFRTRTGEMTILAAGLSLLSKALRPLPEKWHGLRNVETRYRQRYLDLIVNEPARRVFETRAAIITAMRRFLDARGFIEVETPVLQPIYGGAFAKPFVTHHEKLKGDFFLRISDELYLKRLIVGGLERVYEIGKDFRNEGIDRFHNPEFTQLEAYQAFTDYTGMMGLIETMMAEVVEVVSGGLEVEYQGKKLDFTPPWKRVSYFELLEERTGVDFVDLTLEETLKEAEKGGVTVHTRFPKGKVLDQVFEEKVQPHLVQPTIVKDYPKDVSPLAKVSRSDERVVERFEPIVAGLEIGNAFSEQNDPEGQRSAMLQQMEHREKGDLEAQVMDNDYLTALEHGLPPTGGLGVGIDRVTMILTDSKSIRDVILFPQLREEKTE